MVATMTQPSFRDKDGQIPNDPFYLIGVHGYLISDDDSEGPNNNGDNDEPVTT